MPQFLTGGASELIGTGLAEGQVRRKQVAELALTVRPVTRDGFDSRRHLTRGWPLGRFWHNTRSLIVKSFGSILCLL